MNHPCRLFVATAVLALPGTAFGALMSWDFSNVSSSGQVSLSNGLSTVPTLTGMITQTGGGPAENWGGNEVMVARYFGTYSFMLQFTTFDPLLVDHISFQHYHNHNYLQDLNYDVHLQLATSRTTYMDLATLAVNSVNNGAVSTLYLGTMFGAGTYTLRFTAAGFEMGLDTNTDFFALDNVSMEGTAAASVANLPEPATYALVGFGLALAGRIRIKRS